MEHFPSILFGKGAVIFTALVIIFIAEQFFPMAKNLNRLMGSAKNFALALLNFIASPLIVIPLTAFAASHIYDWRPEFWSGWPGLLVDLLLLDFWIYWWHRANHLVPFLWRFHEVHHLDETLDASSALRFHFGEVILSSLVRAAVIFILAMPLYSVVVFEVIVTLSALFHHSNLRMPHILEKAIARVVVTPSLHWVHHHAKREDTDSNYATVLSIWDRLFSSRSKTNRHVDMQIGVEGLRDQALLTLILRPFSRR